MRSIKSLLIASLLAAVAVATFALSAKPKLSLPHKKLSAILQSEIVANDVSGEYDLLVFLNDKVNIADFMAVQDIELRASQLVFNVRVFLEAFGFTSKLFPPS